MNVLITLPKSLIDKILSGDKLYEMRKCLPKHMRIGEDGFFVVEKGTENVRCWCRVDDVIETDVKAYSAKLLGSYLCVSEKYLEKYANSKKVYLWVIGKVIEFDRFNRNWLIVGKNPQQFAYTPLSYGQSF